MIKLNCDAPLYQQLRLVFRKVHRRFYRNAFLLCGFPEREVNFELPEEKSGKDKYNKNTFIRYREYTCLCRARMREFLRRKGEK